VGVQGWEDRKIERAIGVWQLSQEGGQFGQYSSAMLGCGTLNVDVNELCVLLPR
jgi:hypothetical protein